MSIAFVSSSFTSSANFSLTASVSGAEIQSGSNFTVLNTTYLGFLKGDFTSSQVVFSLDSSSFGGNNNVNALVLSASGDKPRIGIGTTDPKTIFDFKDTEDSAVGAELIMRSSRVSQGAITGDEGGSINFIIDSGSYNNIKTSGSLAKIRAKVNTVTDEGVIGSLVFSLGKDTTTVDSDVMEMGYGLGNTVAGFNTVLTSSLEIVDFNASSESTLTMRDDTDTLKFSVNDGNVKISGTTEITGSVTVNNTITAEDLTLTTPPAQLSEDTLLNINGSGVVGTRELSNITANELSVPGVDNRIYFRDSNAFAQSQQFQFTPDFGASNIRYFSVGGSPSVITDPQVGFAYNATSGDCRFIVGGTNSGALIFTRSVYGTNNTFAKFERTSRYFSLYYGAAVGSSGVNGLARLHVSDHPSNGGQPVVKVIANGTKADTAMLVQTSTSQAPSQQWKFTLIGFDKGATDTQVNGTNLGGIYWDPNNTFQIQGNTYQLVFTGAVASGSDRKLKKNIKDTQKGINDIMGLRVRDFNLKTDKNGSPMTTGFIAQEVQETLPELVGIDKDQDHLLVSETSLIPILTKAVQDLQKQVNELKEQLNKKA
jgi:hypothetical protein